MDSMTGQHGRALEPLSLGVLGHRQGDRGSDQLMVRALIGSVKGAIWL